MRFAVLGSPVAHSRSPAMHGAAYAALGLPHSYERLETSVAELPGRVEALRRGELDGVNVTVPHKAAALALADEAAPSAAAIGAANTLVRSADGRIVAHNTDAPALAEELTRLAGVAALAGKTAIVIGSGGAARAAVFALGSLGVTHVIVRARREAPDLAAVLASGAAARHARAGEELRAPALARATDGASEPLVAAPTIAFAPLAAPPSEPPDLAAIVQCTTAGMDAGAPGDVAVDAVAWASVPASCVAYDVVYAPPLTPFLERAAAYGLRSANGLGCSSGRARSRSSCGSGSPRRATRCSPRCYDARVSATPPIDRTPPNSPGAGERIRQVTAKNVQRLGYRRIVQLLVYLIIIPTVLLLAIGIILMFFTGEARINLLFGILTVSFVSVVITGIILVLVFVRREANLSELQADFVSKVSHELRTPLTAIRLFAETLQRPDATDATREKCTTLLVAESERLSKMIERLLDWGKMEAGRKIYELKRERVADILEDALRAYAPHREVNGELDFGLEVAPDLPDVVVDRHAIVDSLVNLLSNAQKYGGSPPKIRMAVTAKDDEVTISVSDNGAGIPRPEHRRIFDKFYRIDDRLSRIKEGSGLGLAIVKHVARAHHAKVLVDSEEGKGSTFALVLPARDASAASG